MKPSQSAAAALLACGGLVITPFAHSAPPAKVVPAKPPVATPGEPSTAEIRRLLDSAPKSSEYPSAAKVTLLDLADITVKPDGSSRQVVRQTIKVLNRRGRDEESEIKIPYNSVYETIKLIYARTIRPDGTVKSVRPSEIRDQGASGADGSYDDAHVLSFSMPAVDDDCIIDFQYEKVQKTSQMPGQFWFKWYFQGGFDPVKYTKLTITAPKSVTLQSKIENTPVKAVVKDLPGGNVLYTWEDKNVAPFQLEPMMPEAESLLPTLAVSTLPSWQTVADWYSDLAKGRMTADDTIKKQVKEITAGKTTPEEKAKAIFYRVQDSTRYVAIELGISAYQPRPAADVCSNQYGDCKDMATLLVAMLREAGITAYPVLLEAGSQEKKADLLPSPGAFNHAICVAEIGGKQYWLDATAQVCPWGVIPSSDRGSQGFVIRDGKGKFETIPYGMPDDRRTTQNVKLALAADGSAKGTVTLSGTGDVDMSLRGALLYLPQDKLRPYMESIAQNIGPNARVSNIKLSEFRDKDVPVTITMDVAFPSWASQSDDVLTFKARPEQGKGAFSSPFREEGRILPITQTASAMGLSSLEVTLPSGYTVLSVPKSTEVKSDLGRYQRTVNLDGSKLTIVTRAEDFQADVPAARYDDVRKYYDNYLRAADQLVIVKKN